MPEYLFEHPKNGEVRSVFLGMNDEKRYSAEGVKWNRVWSNPQAAVDTKWDPLDSKDFARKSASRKGSLGDLFDKSRELSQRREAIVGRDFVKEKAREAMRRRRGGRILPCEVEENREKTFLI